MILEANERGNGAQLALHLLNSRDNDHVTVHSVEGFVANDLHGAFAEAEAISKATQCQNYLFSLSLNPPQGNEVPVEVFEKTIADVERKLGLVGQPRAIVFHEKKGRRHAHCVWSRIDAGRMRAINISLYKRKLMEISRDLYLAHDWQMPDGFNDQTKRDPLNFSRAEAGQAQQAKRDPRVLKAMFRSCWEASDSRTSFAAALKEQGFALARGNRRGFVAVDTDGKIWSLSRWCGVAPKEMRARLGPEADLPSLKDLSQQRPDLGSPQQDKSNAVFEQRRASLVAKQRHERTELLNRQEQRRIDDLTARQTRIPRGLRAALAKATGQYQKILQALEQEAAKTKGRDREEQQHLIERHLKERRAIDRKARQSDLSKSFSTALRPDPRQKLVLPADDLALSREQLMQNPALILGHISKTKAQFSRADVLRGLTQRIDDPSKLQTAAQVALQSPELIHLGEGINAKFTTKGYRDTEANLDQTAQSLSSKGGFSVGRDHITSAVTSQNKQMQKAFGGKLSNEQRSALEHILGDQRLASVVGLAGAGKSTILATARDAWAKQGITVHGAALAGKAADGLQSASDIQSRTLASLELSWKNGNEPIKSGEVLVVDEAGMIGTRQMARVTAKINDVGAKLVLVGDPDQLQPIESGTPFRRLVDTHGASRLTEIHRQRTQWQKQASLDLANGRISKAVAQYEDKQSVTRSDTRGNALEALVESYAMDVAANGNDTSRLAFAHRRKDVHALNQAIRTTLRSTENPPPETLLSTGTGQRAFSDGERIVFTRNDKETGVKNGMLGTVQRVSDSKMSVLLDGDKPTKVTFDPRQFRSFDHGYAVTIHKSQGATVDQSYVLASRTMDQHLAYVAMTRHREGMHLFVNEQDKPTWAKTRDQRHIPRAGPSRSGPSMS